MARKEKLAYWVLSLAGLSMLLWGCSSTSRLKDYPNRIVDRPYTLLEGMSGTELNLSLGYPKSTTVYDLSQPLPLYASWVHAVSDDFSFIWYVLPLGFRYQLVKNPDHHLGVQFFNHIGDPDDPSMSPNLLFTDRIRIGGDWDLQNDLGAQVPILFKQNKINGAFSWMGGPRWQFHDDHLAHFWAGILREQIPEVGVWSLSGGINYTYRFSDQFDLELRLVQKLVGQRISSVSDTLGSIGIRCIW